MKGVSSGILPGDLGKNLVEFRGRNTHGVVESYAEENILGNLVSYKSVSMAMLSQ